MAVHQAEVLKARRYGNSPSSGDTRSKNKSGEKTRGRLGLLDTISRGQEQVENEKLFLQDVFYILFCQ